MLNSAGGGEAPDRRVEGVMSRPAGEALPQRPRPARPAPTGGAAARGAGLWAWGAALGGTTDTARALPRCPRLPHAGDRSTGATGPPGPRGREERRVALVAPRAPPQGSPSHPARPSLALPSPPLSLAAEGPGRAGGGAEPGLRARPLRSGRPDPAAGFRAPRAPRRLRLLLSPPPSATASRVSGPWLCPSRAGAARAPPDPREARQATGVAAAPPWSSGPEAGGCCVRPPRWPPAPAGTLPARAEAAAKSARSTVPRASA